MGGPACLTVNTEQKHSEHALIAMADAVERLDELEAKYSRFKKDSLVSQINSRAGTSTFTPLDLEMYSLLSLAGQLWHETDGLFDPTVGVLNQVWDFRAGKLTSPHQLNGLLDKVGWNLVEWGDRGIRLPVEGMEIDLGGLVKEFAADAAAAMLRQAGFNSALIELAGDIVAVGEEREGKAWQIGIRDPQEPHNSVMSVNLTNAAICTSGNYARRFHYEGRLVSHLLNPQTGQPIDGPCSVSVIGESALVAGAVATAGCIQNEEQATNWLKKSALPWLLIDKHNHCCGPIQSRPLC